MKIFIFPLAKLNLQTHKKVKTLPPRFESRFSHRRAGKKLGACYFQYIFIKYSYVYLLIAQFKDILLGSCAYSMKIN